MSDLIPIITLSDLRKLKVSQIKRLKSAEVYSDGEYLCTLVNPQTDYIKLQAEYMGQLSNSVSGEDLEAILSKEAVHV